VPVTVLALEGATAAYDGRVVLHGVDLAVDRGDFVAVLGANGSGKSTTVRAALGLVPLTTGSVELFGTPLARFREWPRVGYVPQRTGATSGVPATVREVVAAGRLSRQRRLGRTRPSDRAAVDEALRVVGLADRAGDRATSLSGGQQQRVLIARALASEPELLVLDEPTAGVDAEVQAGLADALCDLVAHGVAVVLVAHELGPLQPLVHRAVVMRSGHVVHDGPPPDPDDLHALDPEHAHPPHDPHAHHHHSATGWAL
jgi:zinc transport system ATP-binding protein